MQKRFLNVLHYEAQIYLYIRLRILFKIQNSGLTISSVVPDPPNPIVFFPVRWAFLITYPMRLKTYKTNWVFPGCCLDPPGQQFGLPTQRSQ